MPGKIDIITGKLKGKGIRSFNRDLIIFTFFLFLSFVFWYLNSLRKEIEVEVRYPVRYINPPKNRTISGDLPDKLLFHMKGPGYSIVKIKLSGNRVPLVIDFSRITYKRLPGGRVTDYYIVTSDLSNNFSRQFKADFQIVTIKPDTIRLGLEPVNNITK